MIIRVYGLPTWAGSGLPTLAEDLKRNVCSVTDAHLDPSHVYVFFPAEMGSGETGKELLAYVDTETKDSGYVLNFIGQAVGSTLQDFAKVRLTSCQAVEVLVRPNHSGDEMIVYRL